VTPIALSAGVLAALAAWLGSPRGARRTPAGHRTGAVEPFGTRTARGGPFASRAGRIAPRAVSLLAGCAALAVVGFPVGVPLAVLAVAFGPRIIARLEPAASRRERARQLGDLPLTAELVASALAAGCPLREALAVTMEVTGGPLAARLAVALGELRLGAPPDAAWSAAFSDAPEAVRELAGTFSEAELRGVAPIPQLAAIAERQRRTAATAAAAAAQRAGVRSVLPLGLCFLPAFILVGVLPVVAGAIHLVRM